MPFALLCKIAPDVINELKALRGTHLAYIQQHADEILFGGPARSDNGLPETMIIILKTDDRSHAQAFIDQEPYNASGKIFSRVDVKVWSQVIPESAPGVLASAIGADR
jgi:uncharacterized protein YciI